jgi:hypothetical protein
MNWDAIGAIGEILGAAAVLATLFYLAAQIRQNTISTRTSSELQVTKMEQQWVAGFDPELQEVFDRVATGETDDAVERRYLWKLSEFCTIAQGVFDQYETGMVSERSWKTIERSLTGFLHYEFTRVWWDRRSGNYSPAFCEYIDKTLADSPEWIPIATKLSGNEQKRT